MKQAFVETKPSHSIRNDAIDRNLERIAWLMDRAVTIPGTRITVGLDALLGLLPIGGDVLTGLVQAAVVLVALSHYRVPKSVAARMMANVLLDVAAGSVPILGDLFDVAFKANTRNIKLLDPYRHRVELEDRYSTIPVGRVIDHRPRGTSWRYILPIAVVLFTALILVIIGFITVVRWLFGT